MNDSDYQQLSEQSRRRRLTPAELAELREWFVAHPEKRADWETEIGLTETLARLPDVPVPTNFTARVLEAVERDAAANARRGLEWKFSWHFFLPRATVAAVVLGAGLFTYHEHLANERAQLARSVAAVSEVSSLPDPEILQDFEAIRQMNQTPPADEELLALMKPQ